MKKNLDDFYDDTDDGGHTKFIKILRPYDKWFNLKQIIKNMIAKIYVQICDEPNENFERFS